MVATTVVLLMKEEKRATRDPILKIKILELFIFAFSNLREIGRI